MPFDAIEFDPMIAAGDVLYDLAFLLMDLIERGLTQAANTVCNRYLTEARRDSDLDALAALPLFMSVRAAIRAKVTAARLETTDKDAASSHRQKRRHLLSCSPASDHSAQAHAGRGRRPVRHRKIRRWHAMLAPHIAPAPGAVLLRSDVERKIMFGVGETDRLGAEAYSKDVTRKVYETIARKAQRVIEAGHSAVVDAVFSTSAERAAIEAVAAKGGVPFRGSSLPRTSPHESNALAAGAATPRMPMRKSFSSRKPTASVALTGTQSTPRDPTTQRSRMPAPRSRGDAFGGEVGNNAASEPLSRAIA